MKIEIVTTELITVIGLRITERMNELGPSIKLAFSELKARKDEIQNIKDSSITYSVTPPNYKGNRGPLDFYVCYEVEPMINLPHGMVHLHILPNLYSKTHYKGPASKADTAYDFTSQWMKENGYASNEAGFYYERYDEKMTTDSEDPNNEVSIYCPVKYVG